MAKSKKEGEALVTNRILVTESNIAELCELIPTGRPTSEFAEKQGVVFTTETEGEVVKHYAYVGQEVVEQNGIWSVEVRLLSEEPQSEMPEPQSEMPEPPAKAE